MISIPRALVVLAIPASFALGCGGAAVPAAAPAAPAASAAVPAAPAALKAPGDAKVGDRTTCPISGDEFVVAADSPKAEFEGKTYYFCCPGCVKKFSADPAKYAKKK